jgi:hypothetical protein
MHSHLCSWHLLQIFPSPLDRSHFACEYGMLVTRCITVRNSGSAVPEKMFFASLYAGTCLRLSTCPTGKTSLFTALSVLDHSAADWRGHAHILDRESGSKRSLVCSSTHSNTGHAMFEQRPIEYSTLEELDPILRKSSPQSAPSRLRKWSNTASSPSLSDGMHLSSYQFIAVLSHFVG